MSNVSVEPAHEEQHDFRAELAGHEGAAPHHEPNLATQQPTEEREGGERMVERVEEREGGERV